MTRGNGNKWKAACAAVFAVVLIGACDEPTEPEGAAREAPDVQSVTGSHGGGAAFAVRLLLGLTSNSRSCTGVVLSQHWVMTAAHCVRGLPVSRNPTRVRAGDIATSSTADVFNGLASYYTHPEYSGRDSDMGDDFALILLMAAG